MEEGCEECNEQRWLHLNTTRCSGEWTARPRFTCPEVFISRTDVKRGNGPFAGWDKFVLFTIRVVDGRARWQLEKRYSHFVALDSALRKKYKGMSSMPPFPPLGHEWADWARTNGSFTQKLQVEHDCDVFPCLVSLGRRNTPLHAAFVR